MNESRLAWRMLAHGLKWGGFMAVATALSLPVLYDITLWLTAILGGNTYLGPMSRVIPEVWALFFGLGLLCSFLPTVAGGGVLGMSLYLLVSKKPMWVKRGMWMGIVVGVEAGAFYLSLFFASDWSFSIHKDWLLAGLIGVWEVIMYAWLGKRLVDKFVNSG